jgi:hypothetical protein
MQNGSTGSSIIELDQEVGQAIIKDLVERNDIDQVRYIPPLN